MNTGVQRSGATPPAARTATTKAVGPEPGNVFGQGKSVPLIAMAHEIPYVATATVADLRDLEAKVEHAMELRGARYIHVFVPCPLGWGSAVAGHDPDRPARRGDRPVPGLRGRARRGRRRSRRSAAGCPVEDYLRPQRRFAHLFEPERAHRRDRQDPGRSRPQHRPIRAAGGEVMDKPFAITLDVGSSRANKTGSWRTERAGLRRPDAAVQPRLPGRGEHASSGCTTPRAGDYERAWRRDHGRQPVPGRHGPGLLPPVRDRLQPRPARRGGRDQLGRALPRRRGDPAGLDASRSTAPPSGKRVLVVGAGPVRAVGRLPPRARRARGHDPRRRTASRRDDALRHPPLPAPARGPRRRDRSGSSTSAWRSSCDAKVTDLRSAHAGRRLRRRVPRRRRAHRPARLHPRRQRGARARRGLGAALDGGRGRRRSWAAASSSTAAATRPWTWPAPPGGWAPRRRSSSTGGPASGCPPTTSRSRRPSRRACSMQVAVDDQAGRRRPRGGGADGARRGRLPAADRRARGARGRLRGARARPGGRPLAARGRARARGRRRGRAGRRADDDRLPGDLRGRRHGARRAHA